MFADCMKLAGESSSPPRWCTVRKAEEEVFCLSFPAVRTQISDSFVTGNLNLQW